MKAITVLQGDYAHMEAIWRDMLQTTQQYGNIKDIRLSFDMTSGRWRILFVTRTQTKRRLNTKG